MINHATIAQLHTDMHFSALNVAHITPEIFAPVLEQILAYPEVTLVQSFTSFEQRPILHLRMGTGPVKILMWSQMHGDESTATAALMDFIHLLCRQTEYNFNDWQIRFTIDIVPMLNPDGAAKHTRVNGQFIDINRDALVLQSPEGRVLQHLVSSLQPDLALNLHDQNAYHGISERQHTSTIAMLAPVADHAKHITPVRKQAMQLICAAQKVLREYIPNHVARFDDTFSPRSFGDNIVSQGVSTILIESGTFINDPHRQVARKMNVLTYFTLLDALLHNKYEHYTIEDYFAIPEHQDDVYVDLKLTDLLIANTDHPFTIDITINVDKHGSTNIEHLGDCHTVKGFKELSLSGYQLISDYQDLQPDSAANLIFVSPSGLLITINELLST
ncbi:MAG TPA: peptidase M14 [Glaciecola sp.]|nr:peptidase M14 [Glaciecola sp.]